jgi:hypothetical protein
MGQRVVGARSRERAVTLTDENLQVHGYTASSSLIDATFGATICVPARLKRHPALAGGCTGFPNEFGSWLLVTLPSSITLDVCTHKLPTMEQE